MRVRLPPSKFVFCVLCFVFCVLVFVFSELEFMMKFSELKNGDIIVRADGAVRMLIANRLKGNTGYLECNNYREDLSCDNHHHFRITKIYRSKDTFGHGFVWSDREAYFRPGEWSLIYEAPPAPPEIKIDNRVVEFNEDGIKVGCTTISKEIVNQIYARMNAKPE